MKIKSILYFCSFVACLTMNISCSDFFDQDSDHVIFADGDHLNNATDTIYSVTGILNKLQVISDRTILLGEARADLVDVTTATSSDLRNVALFNINDSNEYNSPKDYYSIINNCNYFLAKTDTALKNNRNETIFEKEYAAVKAIRAWTYLQLVLNYGKVPFVTDPILSEMDAAKEYPKADITTICNYFINDIAPYADVAKPNYGTIRNTDSRFFYFPINILLGDLNLWAGNYKAAALNYYKYISTRNGTNSSYPIGTDAAAWGKNVTKYIVPSDYSYNYSFREEAYYNNSELITMIPGDSIPMEGNYSQLRSIFNSNTSNNYKVSLTPSQEMYDISASQVYCNKSDKNDVTYVPGNLTNNYSGDLRFSNIFNQREGTYNKGNCSIQSLNKYSTRNVHIYRKTGVYLRMAEALNRAGMPKVAFAILSKGLNNQEIDSLKKDYPNDSTWLDQLNFPNSSYTLRMTNSNSYNTIGIHSRGSGWTEYNAYYVFPDDSTLNDNERLNYQVTKVEDMIIDENALEMGFEGTRFYDLMRVALRRNDPSYLADRIYKRKGSNAVSEMKGSVKKNLYDVSSWYLSWKGQIGF